VSFRIIERLFVIVLLLNSMGMVTALMHPDRSQRDSVSTELHTTDIALDGAVNLCGVSLVLVRWRRVLRAARAAWPLVALSALAVLSAAWSVQPMVTLRRSALLIVSTLMTLYLGERYSTERFARLLAQTLCLMMLLVVMFRILAPSYVFDEVGYWRGLSAYKNAFGEYMAVAIALLLLVRFRHFDCLRYVFLLIAAVLLVLSHSATSLFCCVLVVAAMPLWRLTRVKGAVRYAMYLLMVVVSALGVYSIYSHTSLLFQMLGRDSTLTGRTRLWSALLPEIAKRPIVGYGYEAFWTSLKGEVVDVWIGNGWVAHVADNGYLDLCLSLGAAGVCVFAYLWFRSCLRGMKHLRSESAAIGLWPITYLCFFAIHNVGESTLLTTGTFPFLIFSVLATSLAVKKRPDVTVIRTAGDLQADTEWTLRALAR
jgi:exopolysaccharide production protein ExoQ